MTMIGPTVSCRNFFLDHKTNHESSPQDAVCSVWCVLLRYLKSLGTLQRHMSLLKPFSKHQTTEVSDGSNVKFHEFFTSREMRSHFTFGSGNPSEDTDEITITYRSREIKHTNVYYCVI
jgi:hypothetical protein